MSSERAVLLGTHACRYPREGGRVRREGVLGGRDEEGGLVGGEG